MTHHCEFAWRPSRWLSTLTYQCPSAVAQIGELHGRPVLQLSPHFVSCHYLSVLSPSWLHSPPPCTIVLFTLWIKWGREQSIKDFGKSGQSLKLSKYTITNIKCKTTLETWEPCPWLVIQFVDPNAKWKCRISCSRSKKKCQRQWNIKHFPLLQFL